MSTVPFGRAARRAMASRPAPLQRQAPLRMHIDHLVLDQLPVQRSERGRVQAATLAELERLFGARALRSELWTGMSTSPLRLEDIRLRDGASPEQIGRQIAHVLFRGLCPP